MLRGIDPEVHEGEFVAVIGHSGCGKSPLLNIVAGLLRATEGGVFLAGREVDEPGPDRTVVFQNHGLLPWPTVYENVRLAVDRTVGQTLSGAERDGWTRRNLALVRMEAHADKRPAEISGGMEQRVGIARALPMRPRVLLLDEPFGALDALTRAHPQDQLMDIHARLGTTVVTITHDVDEAVLLSDHIVMMTNGPNATIGELLEVDLPRPCDRLRLVSHPRFLAAREAVLRVLHERHAPPAAARAVRVLVVGAGPAGRRCARRLAGVDVVRCGDEPTEPYDRVALGQILAGRAQPRDLVTCPAERLHALGVDFRSGTRIVDIDPLAGRARTAGGEAVAWDRLVLATGSEAIRLPVPGADLEGVFVHGRLADVLALRRRVVPGLRAVVIGGGLLGLEAAGALVGHGARVTVVHAAPWPMERQLDAGPGDLLARTLRTRFGIDFVMPATTFAIEGESAVRLVRLADGTRLPAELVVMAVGVRPKRRSPVRPDFRSTAQSGWTWPCERAQPASSRSASAPSTTG